MKKETEKQLMIGGATVLLALFVIWYFRNKNNTGLSGFPSQPTPTLTIPSSGYSAPQTPLTPIDYTYAANPSQFGPANINVNVSDQNPSWLSNGYIPLFGFVGIAQGSTWQ
jgi:hypothetical protein